VRQRHLFGADPAAKRERRRPSREEAMAAWTRSAVALGEEARALLRGLGECDQRAALEEGERMVREAAALVEVARVGVVVVARSSRVATPRD
jgi:hypothetical protein